MDTNFFKTTRILDGGMGQELLAKGMKTRGTLWSANAVLDSTQHELLVDTHLDFIDAGAEVIVTATFCTRRQRLRDNGAESQFEYANRKAGELAVKARELSGKQVLIAGGLPPQDRTYEADSRSDDDIRLSFREQATLLEPYVDFFYLDVLSSAREIKLAVEGIKDLGKPYLVGIHISEGTRLPSGDTITDVVNDVLGVPTSNQLLGIMLSCVSPENYYSNLKEIRSLGIPFGFKVNAFKTTKPKNGYTNTFNKTTSGNPNEFLGQRKELTADLLKEIARVFVNAGATIVGGCCETRPSHIQELSCLKFDHSSVKPPLPMNLSSISSSSNHSL
jgi:homocysteine S-methyltransferase